MYRDQLTQNRSRELISTFLDEFIAQRGWWAARAAWVSDEGMLIDPWRVASAAPLALQSLRRHAHPVDPVDLGAERFTVPAVVAADRVAATRGVRDILDAVGVDTLVVVDVPGVGPFDLQLVFVVDPAHGDVSDGYGALRTGIALLPTLIRQEVERDALRLGALRDPLTGLLNRSGLDELSAELPPSEHVRAVLYIDLDGFKEVNDAYGHSAGDAVLTVTAQQLASQVRPSDLVARWGGDEFVVIADAVIDEASAVALAQRMVAAVSRDVTLESGAVVSVAASTGVVIWPEGQSLVEVIAAADELMYEAKRIGGGIAMQDSAGHILVRDPLGAGAPPEYVERGRAPAVARRVDALDVPALWGAHVLMRGEMCTMSADDAADVVVAAVAGLALDVPPPRLLIEPRGQGWAREGVLAALVARLHARMPNSAVIALVDETHSSVDIRLTAVELRADGALEVALGGVGAVNGGDLRAVAQVMPTLLALDHEAVLNLSRTRPSGIVAKLAAALGQVVGIPLLVIDPPAEFGDDLVQSWGVGLVARPHPPTIVPSS